MITAVKVTTAIGTNRVARRSLQSFNSARKARCSEEETANLKSVVDALVYASVVLGGILLIAAAPLVPIWLLASLAAGEVAYLLAALYVARGTWRAYYVVMALAVLVLVVSLPQPGHYEFSTSGQVGAFLIFAAGSALQICLIVTIPILLRRTRRAPHFYKPNSGVSSARQGAEQDSKTHVND